VTAGSRGPATRLTISAAIRLPAVQSPVGCYRRCTRRGIHPVFPVRTEDGRPPLAAVQIRHQEDPSRSRRWRGELMISVEASPNPASVIAGPNAIVAKLWRTKQPLQVQLHQWVHERLYSRIAEAFAKTNLAAESPKWEGVVRGMAPLIHVRGTDHNDPFFPWAQKAVRALEACWSPASG
jgi:hypothetical protein